jgi:uncharacterized protein YdhG (YjbR/CyaY superfamily)
MVQNIFELGSLGKTKERTQDIVDTIYRNLKSEVESGREFLYSKVTFIITFSEISAIIHLKK